MCFGSWPVSVCVVPLAESEGTLILPQVESYHRLQDDDASTVTSDETFFSAAEVSSFPLLSEGGQKPKCTWVSTLQGLPSIRIK